MRKDTNLIGSSSQWFFLVYCWTIFIYVFFMARKCSLIISLSMALLRQERIYPPNLDISAMSPLD